MRAASYPRRQQYRRISRALQTGALATVAGGLALAAAHLRLTGLALVLATVAFGSAGRSHRWVSLARRSRIGADSEQRVRNELETLEREGWRISHSLRWHRGGDIDHVAIAPAAAGVAFAIETKTRSYLPGALQRVGSIAFWLGEHRASWCRRGAIPILCLAGTRGVERWEAGVAVVSLDRLVSLLRRLAGTTRKPGFLA